MEEAIRLAMEEGDFKRGMRILTRNPNLVDWRLYRTRADTLLLAAVIHDRLDLVHTLITKFNAYPWHNCEYSIWGRNIFSMSRDSLPMLRLLLRLTQSWSDDQSKHCIITGYRGAIEDFMATGEEARAMTFLEFHPNLKDVCTATGVTAMSAAAHHSKREIVDKLLLELEADPWAGSTALATPLCNYILDKSGVTGAGEVFEEWA